MPAEQAEQLTLLQVARHKGWLASGSATAFVGVHGGSVLDDLVAGGLLQEGAAGVRLTATGRERLAALLAHEREETDAVVLRDLYGAFAEQNSNVKVIVTSWQLRPDGRPNDHEDDGYDEAVLRRLASAADQAQLLLEHVEAAVPRLACYRSRLATALRRAQAGDRRLVAHPLVDSYHQIWFELHEDLLGLLGLSREDEARAGRAE